MKAALGAAVAALLLLASGCSDDESPKPTKATPTIDPFSVSCPEVPVEKQQLTDFRPTERDAPKLLADLTVYPLSPRNYCVRPDSFESPAIASKIVSYTVELDQRDNYGERYSTFIDDGSDELLNFPFYFHVYGKCRTVTATIVVRSDGVDHTYRAETSVGPQCPA